MKSYAVFPGLEALFQASKTRRWLDLPQVAQTVREVSDYLSELTGEPEDISRFLMENARPHRADMDRMFVAHTAIQFGIARQVWDKLTIDGVVGCSVGDLARLAVSQVITLRETIDLVWFCALHRRLCPEGRMANVRPKEGCFSPAQLDWLNKTGISVSVWSDRHAAISGTNAEVDAIITQSSAHGLKIRTLYDYPFHSMAMAPVAQEIQRNVGRWHPEHAVLPVYSSVYLKHISTPQEMTEEALAGACCPVQWKRAVEKLADEHSVTHLVNIGPSDTLTAWIAESEIHANITVVDAWDLCSKEDCVT